MTPEAEHDFLDLIEGGTMPPKRRSLLRAVWEEVTTLRAALPNCYVCHMPLHPGHAELGRVIAGARAHASCEEGIGL
jgi:hypothetical protein